MARVPLYKKAETELLRRIRSGSWPVGTRIGNEFELAEEFGVSQGTMRRALMSVEAMGLLHRKPGRGTVVADPGAAQTAPTGPRRHGPGPTFSGPRGVRESCRATTKRDQQQGTRPKRGRDRHTRSLTHAVSF